MSMIISNAKEMEALTGNYFASSQFHKIKTDIVLESEAITRLIGKSVFDKALLEYDKPTEVDLTPKQNELVERLQLPIATMAALRYHQGSMVTHGDNGRKVKVNSEHEKMAWEWMIEADDLAQIRKAQAATDRLLNYLEDEEVEEWTASDARKEVRSLFVNSTVIFQKVFPIDQSPTFFYTVSPFLRLIQNTQIKPAMGDGYQPLFDAWQENSVTDENKPLLELIQQAMALLTIGMATRRLSIQVLPDSVVQSFRSQSINSTKPAYEQAIQRFRKEIMEEGLDLLDQAKKLRNNSSEPPVLLPKNDPDNKYMRT